MIGIPFFQKKKEVSVGYVFFLFLAGEKVYGMALSESDSGSKSALYSESVDPFLKNAALKLDKILGNCERDLGGNIFLKKTVLFLNSVYMTESGTIREDYLKIIKKLLRDMELENDGYVNFYDVISQEYGKLHEHYFALEESVYDYVLFEFRGEKLAKTTRIAKTQNQKTDMAELAKACPPESVIFSFFVHNPPQAVFAHEKTIGERELGAMFTKLYLRNHAVPSVSETEAVSVPEVVQTPEVLPPVSFTKSEPKRKAPGFVVEELQEEDKKEPIYGDAAAPLSGEMEEESAEEVYENEQLEPDEPVKKPALVLPKLLTSFHPGKKYALLLVPAILLALFLGYLVAVHSAQIHIVTQKENFSTKTSFIIGGSDGFGKEFDSAFSVKVSGSTTGQKSIGDFGKGEVTIYSGLFEQKVLAAGTTMETSSGVSFTLAANVTVPAATTSGTLDSGGIVTKPGKTTVSLAASSIGPEGNISQSTKLYFEQYKDTDMYAVASKEFTGGYRRKIRVFSSDDALALDKRAFALVQKDMQEKFALKQSDNTIFLNDTLSTADVKKNYSVKVNAEAESVSLTMSGNGTITYVAKDKLIEKVQQEKLRDKEFVPGTFAISGLKMEKKDKGSFVYSATVNGKVQRFVDESQLVKLVSGKIATAAVQALSQEHGIQSAKVTTKPIPIPFVPWSAGKIRFFFEN